MQGSNVNIFGSKCEQLVTSIIVFFSYIPTDMCKQAQVPAENEVCLNLKKHIGSNVACDLHDLPGYE